MRDFDFLGTWEDSWCILQSILEGEGFSVSPDRWYEEPEASFFRELTPDLKRELHERRRLYIWNPSYTSFPPVLERQKEGPRAGRYFIKISQGGPGLELTLPACFEREGTVVLNYGSLSYPGLVEDPATGKAVKAPAALVAGFRTAIDLLRPCLVHRDQKWLGRYASELLRDGRARLAATR